MTSAVYLLGAPGVGKSTVMARLLGDWDVGSVFDYPHHQTGRCPCEPYCWGCKKWTSREMFGHVFQHDELGAGAYLGHIRREYPGTDALSRSVQPQAMLWLESLPLLGLSWVWGEGERLANTKFLAALGERTDLQVVHLVAPPDVLERRRLGRPGKPLTDKHCLSKATQSANLARDIGAREVDATQTVDEIIKEIFS